MHLADRLCFSKLLIFFGVKLRLVLGQLLLEALGLLVLHRHLLIHGLNLLLEILLIGLSRLRLLDIAVIEIILGFLDVLRCCYGLCLLLLLLFLFHLLLLFFLLQRLMNILQHARHLLVQASDVHGISDGRDLVGHVASEVLQARGGRGSETDGARLLALSSLLNLRNLLLDEHKFHLILALSVLLQLRLVLVLVQVIQCLHVVHEGALIVRRVHILHDSLSSIEDLREALGTVSTETLGTNLRCSNGLLEQVLSVLLLGWLRRRRLRLLEERLREIVRLLLEVLVQNFGLRFRLQFDNFGVLSEHFGGEIGSLLKFIVGIRYHFVLIESIG